MFAALLVAAGCSPEPEVDHAILTPPVVAARVLARPTPALPPIADEVDVDLDVDDVPDRDDAPDVDDADGEGVLDVDDKCPDEPETYNGFEDDDGCPDHVLL